jgi:hypothetical protein
MAYGGAGTGAWPASEGVRVDVGTRVRGTWQ